MSLFYCADCGEWIEASLSDCIIINDELICPNCRENYVKCWDCGKWIKEEDATVNADGFSVCQDCLDSNYFFCEDCNEWHYYNEAITINEGYRDEKLVCESCAEANYYKCSDCSKWFNSNRSHFDSCGTMLCNDCINDYYTCEDCGKFVHNVRAYFDDDYVYCETCFYDNHHDRNNNFIYDYGDRPTLQYHQTEEDVNNYNQLFFGFELEIAINTDYAEDFLSFFNEDEIYLSYDSSVDGFEIVSHPMSWNYLNGEFKNRLEKALNYAKSVGAKGHNKGGMHIHISRDGINDTQLKRLHNFLYAKASHQKYEIIKTISQRQEHNIHWCNWSDTSIKGLFDNRNIKELKKYTKKSNKYTSINLNHSNTIEFRIFNSNLRIERVYKNLEFIKALLDYTNLHNCKSLYKHFFKWLAQSENRNKYMNLFSFLEEKNLIKPLRHPLTVINSLFTNNEVLQVA